MADVDAGNLGWTGDLPTVISRRAGSSGRCISNTAWPLVNRLGVWNASPVIGDSNPRELAVSWTVLTIMAIAVILIIVHV